MPIIFDNTLIKTLIFNNSPINKAKLNSFQIFEKRTNYTPEMVQQIVSPYGVTKTITLESPKTGGAYDNSNITVSGDVPINSLSLNTSSRTLSFYVDSCAKGLTSTIKVPVINCDEYFDYEIPIKVESCTHPNMTQYPANAPTCTASGNYAYYKCSCSNNTLNSSGNLYDPSRSALGHSFTSQNTSSTYLKYTADCISAPQYYYSCSRCGAKGTSTFSYGSALGHSFTQDKIWDASGQLRTAATCTAAATYWRECDRCTAHSTTQYFSSGSALGHNYVDYKCTRCNNIKAVTITSQPSDLSGAAGTTQHCTVIADGYNLTYKWYYKDSAASSYKLSTTQSTNKLYRELSLTQFPSKKVLAYCIITDGYGNSVTTRTVTMTIK